jgi:hypothetical protein
MRNFLGALKVNELKARLRTLRLIQFALILSILMFARVAEFDRDPGTSDWTLRHWFVIALALWGVLGGLRFRHRMLTRSQQTLTIDTSDPKVLKQWMSGHIYGMAIAESLALWGVVVRMSLSGAFWQASLFYAASLTLLLLWTPQFPSGLRAN